MMIDVSSIFQDCRVRLIVIKIWRLIIDTLLDILFFCSSFSFMIDHISQNISCLLAICWFCFCHSKYLLMTYYEQISWDIRNLTFVKKEDSTIRCWKIVQCILQIYVFVYNKGKCIQTWVVLYLSNNPIKSWSHSSSISIDKTSISYYCYRTSSESQCFSLYWVIFNSFTDRSNSWRVKHGQYFSTKLLINDFDGVQISLKSFLHHLIWVTKPEAVPLG